MPSKRQFEANRENAKKSTGPKTTIGKSRSSRNALRHGFARTAHGNDDGTSEIASAAVRSLLTEMRPGDAADLARSSFQIGQVRLVRFQLLSILLEAPTPKQAKRVLALERYERV